MTAQQADLAGVLVGAGHPVAVMGVINVSPESFHPGSVHTDDEAMLRTALSMVDDGAALIDVGARSTAPYLPTEISEPEEADRLRRAVARLAAKLPVPVSADTCRPGPARAALEAGARVINDVSGLRDAAVARLAAEHGASVIAMAAPAADRPAGEPLPAVEGLLRDALQRARAAGLRESRVVLDPGLGFFREGPVAWHEWDARVLAGLDALAALGRPLCVGVSRKSFLGAILGRPDPRDRLAGSLAATAVAVVNGAAVIRTHDVAETVDAVRVAERLRVEPRP